MRFIEIMILLANALTLIFLVLKKKAVWAAAIGLVLIALHLIVEKWRWQMLFAYGAGVMLPIYLIFQYVLHTVYQKQLGAWVNNLVIVICVLLLISSAILSYLLPVFKIKEPGGPMGIGTVSYVWRDETREEMFSSNPADKREIAVQIWYPADKQAQNSSVLSPYFADRAKAGRKLQEDHGFPGRFFQHFDRVKTHAYEAAEFSSEQEKYPVIFFSHGVMATRFAYAFFIEHLVSNGFIVVGLQHPYTSLSTPLSDGRVVTFDKRITDIKGNFNESNRSLAPIVETQAADAVFVLDQIERLQKDNDSSDYWRRFDLKRVGMAGHSLGGATMLETLQRDPRFKSGVHLDGYPYGGADMAGGLRQPVLYMNDHRGTSARYADSSVEAKKRLILQNVGWDLSIKGTHHFMFSDAALYSPLISFMFPYTKGHAISADRAHHIINETTLAFLEHSLKTQSAESLESLFGEFPEVSVTKYSK